MRPSVEELIRLACQAEVLARKPGNVHPDAPFEDLTAADFLIAAEIVAPILANAPNLGIGRAVHDAVVATREQVATNANLGICLLLAPLAAASLHSGELAPAVHTVLGNTTIDDARWVYQAIRLAQPGGLGQVGEQDVADTPIVTLREAMQLATHRDGVARQYATGFADVFDLGIPAATRFLKEGLETAIIGVHLTLMAERPDTLIERKCGPAIALESARRARHVLGSAWPSKKGRAEEQRLDAWLRADAHRRNPGTTADLVAATLFAALSTAALDAPTVTRWCNQRIEHPA